MKRVVSWCNSEEEMGCYRESNPPVGVPYSIGADLLPITNAIASITKTNPDKPHTKG